MKADDKKFVEDLAITIENEIAFIELKPQRQLSKEFVRQWLIDHNFMNQPGQTMPEITDEFAESISERYIELYEAVTGENFQALPYDSNIFERIEENIKNMLARL